MMVLAPPGAICGVESVAEGVELLIEPAVAL
jgi:hypothetical protein